MNRIFVPAAAILAIALGCSPRKPADTPAAGAQSDQKAPAPVEAVVVYAAPITRTVVASGVASGIREASVTCQTQGTIRRVRFTLGQWVSAGELLVELDNDAQKAAYESAKDAAAVSALNLKAVQALFDQGNASEGELTQMRSGHAGARASLEQAKKAYEDTRIIAPIGGFVAWRDVGLQEGNTLSPGTPVTRIVDIGSLKTTLDVGEREVGLLRARMKATVVVPALGDAAFGGAVSAIGAGADLTTGSFPVEVTWKNDQERSVKAGMSVRVTVETATLDTVLLVPAVSIAEVSRRDAVYLSVGGRAVVRFVTTGRHDGNLVEIEEGLSSGDTLLTSGITRMVQGDTLLVTVATAFGGVQ
jgi:membrane fusion protein, multidrug efflux system